MAGYLRLEAKGYDGVLSESLYLLERAMAIAVSALGGNPRPSEWQADALAISHPQVASGDLSIQPSVGP